VASTSCGSDSRRRFVEVTEVWLLVLLGWMEALRWHGWCSAGCDERVYISAKERLPWDGTLFLNYWNTTNPSGVFHLEACYRAKFGNCIGQTIETPIADIHADKLTNQKTKLRRRPIVDIHGTYIHRDRKKRPPKHVKITLWVENVSDYFSLYHEMPSICNVHVKFHDN